MQKASSIAEQLKSNSYPGRGIVIGKSQDGSHAVTAYFIMGRSANSRNRIFVERDDVLYTQPFDVSKVEDPSLILYAAQRKYKNYLILTNGDHTDTICEGLKAGKSFQESLESRTFEPDAPHFTPRISGILAWEGGDFSYKMSILKSADEHGSACHRFTFSYEPQNGIGHLIHTYRGDGNPLQPFEGEPKQILIPDSIDEFATSLWNALHCENRISLFVRYTDLKTLQEEKRLINCHS